MNACSGCHSVSGITRSAAWTSGSSPVGRAPGGGKLTGPAAGEDHGAFDLILQRLDLARPSEEIARWTEMLVRPPRRATSSCWPPLWPMTGVLGMVVTPFHIIAPLLKGSEQQGFLFQTTTSLIQHSDNR